MRSMPYPFFDTAIELLLHFVSSKPPRLKAGHLQLAHFAKSVALVKGHASL